MRSHELPTSWTERALIVGFIALLAGSAIAAYFFVLGPGEKANDQALISILNTIRSGSLPETSGSTTDAALRSIRLSSSHRIERSTSAFSGSDDSRVCVELALNEPSGKVNVALRMVRQGGNTALTHVGLAPPCVCQRSGTIGMCGQ